MTTKSKIISEHMAALGRKGGSSRMRLLSADQRKKLAAKGGKARQRKARERRLSEQ